MCIILAGYPDRGCSCCVWHTICISGDGDVYAFGGNQFGQLGTGTDQAETLPRLLDAPSLENEHAKVVSCGARHSAVVTEGKVFCWDGTSMARHADSHFIDLSHVMGNNKEELLAMAREHGEATKGLPTGGEHSVKEEFPLSATTKVEDLIKDGSAGRSSSALAYDVGSIGGSGNVNASAGAGKTTSSIVQSDKGGDEIKMEDSHADRSFGEKTEDISRRGTFYNGIEWL